MHALAESKVLTSLQFTNVIQVSVLPVGPADHDSSALTALAMGQAPGSVWLVGSLQRYWQ